MGSGFVHVGKLSIYDLETEMMPEEDFLAQAPAGAVAAYKEHQDEGMSTGGGKHDVLGFWVLGTAGQGPYFVWIEDKLTLIVAHDGVVEWTKD